MNLFAEFLDTIGMSKNEWIVLGPCTFAHWTGITYQEWYVSVEDLIGRRKALRRALDRHVARLRVGEIGKRKAIFARFKEFIAFENHVRAWLKEKVGDGSVHPYVAPGGCLFSYLPSQYLTKKVPLEIRKRLAELERANVEYKRLYSTGASSEQENFMGCVISSNVDDDLELRWQYSSWSGVVERLEQCGFSPYEHMEEIGGPDWRGSEWLGAEHRMNDDNAKHMAAVLQLLITVEPDSRRRSHLVALEQLCVKGSFSVSD